MKGAEPLVESMEKVQNAPRRNRAAVVLLVSVVCLAVIGGVLVLRRRSSGTPAVSALRPVPTTVAYNPRPGPGGTKILTEPVDVLSLAVPSNWRSPSSDALTLPKEIDNLAAQAPPLAALLQAEGSVAEKSAIRLFAYQPAAPSAFVSVVSFSSPGATAPTQSGIDAIVALAKKKTANVAVSGADLPVGRVIKLDSALTSQNQHIVVEVLVLVAAGRTMQIQMVSETDAAGVPPLFDQMAQSLHLG
jgi:hypothetical protein